MEQVELGKPPPSGAARDAVHVAVIPMLAVRDMKPGERLLSGIADPYRRDVIKKGEWYWLCLFPGTVTSIRHDWTHPAFPEERPPAAKRRSEADVWAGVPSPEEDDDERREIMED